MVTFPLYLVSVNAMFSCIKKDIKLGHWYDLKICNLKIKRRNQTPVTNICNPSYSGGRDQEDLGSKPAWANSSWDPISKKPFFKKKGWWSGSRCRP
jgi:hypothetical protein